MNLRIVPIDAESARAAIAWRYPIPYDYYNIEVSPELLEAELQFFLDPQNAYHRMLDEADRLIGVCCFGPDARVTGGDYSAPAIDIGLGIAPDFTGRGYGSFYIATVLAFARAQFPAPMYRVTIAAFNTRARRVWEKAGFHPVQTFRATQSGAPFVVMTRMENQEPRTKNFQ
jgi:RimJ/RimL family protein N-acetyltransferase